MNLKPFYKASRVIKQLVGEGKTNFAIFPFGEQGMMVKEILNKQFGIREKHIVDNGLSHFGGGILSLDELKAKMTEDTIILLANDTETIYREIRSQLMARFDITKFVDVFSGSMYFDRAAMYDDRDDIARINMLSSCAKDIYYSGVQGAVAELGVFKGYFSNWISRYFPDRPIYLFDTFAGFDRRDIDGIENLEIVPYDVNKFADTSVNEALNNIGYCGNARIVRGYFPESVEGNEEAKNQKYAFVSLDADLYQPILAGLRFFYRRLSPGGYIFIHDFVNPHYPGPRKAVMEFCTENALGYVWMPDNCSAAISKPAM